MKTIILYQKNIYESLLNNIPGVRNYVVSWRHEINPPLAPNDEISYKISIDTPKTETPAFNDRGAIAGIPTSIPAKYSKLHFTCPQGYKFKFLDSRIVTDMYGNRNNDEIKRIEGPKLSGANTIIIWEIKNLLPGHRYFFKYKFEKEE